MVQFDIVIHAVKKLCSRSWKNIFREGVLNLQLWNNVVSFDNNSTMSLSASPHFREKTNNDNALNRKSRKIMITFRRRRAVTTLTPGCVTNTVPTAIFQCRTRYSHGHGKRTIIRAECMSIFRKDFLLKLDMQTLIRIKRDCFVSKISEGIYFRR